MLFRCVLKFETKRFFLGKTYSRKNKWFIIVKNENTKFFRKGEDLSFFANMSKGFLINKLEPLKEEEILAS